MLYIDQSFPKFWTTMVKNCPKMTVIWLSEGEKWQYSVLWAEYWIWNPLTSYWQNMSCYLTVKLHLSCYGLLISYILGHNGGKLSQYYRNLALRWWKMTISEFMRNKWNTTYMCLLTLSECKLQTIHNISKLHTN